MGMAETSKSVVDRKKKTNKDIFQKVAFELEIQTSELKTFTWLTSCEAITKKIC